MKHFVNFFCKRNMLVLLVIFFCALASQLIFTLIGQSPPVKRALEVPFLDLNEM